MKLMFFSNHRCKLFLAMAFAAVSAVSCHNEDVITADEVMALQDRLDSLSRNYEQVRSQGSVYESQLGEKDSMIRAQTAEIQSLIAQLNRARVAVDADENVAQLREKNAQINTLKKQIGEQERQLKRLEKEVKASSGLVSAETQDQIAWYKSQAVRQERQISDLSEQVASLNTQVGEQNGTIITLKNEKQSLMQRVEALNSRVESLNSFVNTQKDNQDNAELAGCQQRVIQMEGEAVRLQQQLTSLQERVKTCDARQQERDQLDKQVTAMGLQVSQLQELLAQKDARLAVLESQRPGDNSEEVAARVSALREHIASQHEEIDRLTKEVQAKEAALQALQSSVDKGSVASTVSAADKKLSELQAMCENYAQEVERLRAENARLQTENDQLRDEMVQVQRDAEKALTDNSELVQKVALASILVTDGLEATPAKSINGNTVKSTEKASQVMGVRIEGRLLDNNVVDPGTITIYARIATANNRIVANGMPESFDMQGTPMQYTMSQDIEFTGTGRKVLMIWRKQPATEMAAGLYWVTLYANGNEIGKTSFMLK